MNMKPALGVFDLKTVINKNSEINNVTLPDHQGNVYIKKISMNFVSPQELS